MSRRKEQDTPGEEKETVHCEEEGCPILYSESESRLPLSLSLECGWLWEEIEHTANDNGSCPRLNSC